MRVWIISTDESETSPRRVHRMINNSRPKAVGREARPCPPWREGLFSLLYRTTGVRPDQRRGQRRGTRGGDTGLDSVSASVPIRHDHGLDSVSASVML